MVRSVFTMMNSGWVERFVHSFGSVGAGVGLGEAGGNDDEEHAGGVQRVVEGLNDG